MRAQIAEPDHGANDPDGRMERLLAEESQLFRSVAATPIADADDFKILAGLGYQVAREEDDAWPSLDSRLLTLAAAIDLGAMRIVARFHDLEAMLADARAAA